MKAILYDWGGVNVWLFHLINDSHGPYLDRLMLWGTAMADHYLFPLYVAVFGVVGILSARREPEKLGMPWLLALCAFAVAYNLDGLFLAWIKPLLDFPRPPLALPAGSVHVVGPLELHHSLPSGHSSFAMLCAASLWPVLGRALRPLAVLAVLWVGVSRISLGVHFPADVLAGYASSLIIVLLVQVILARMIRPRTQT